MILTNVELLESLSLDNQLMRLTFDDGADHAYIIWNHANLLQYLNDEVIATFRQDMYNGVISKFVNTLAAVSTVQTLSREEGIKLYTDVSDSHCTVRFKDIADGSSVANAIVYCTDIRFDSSARAEWADLTIMDQARKIAQLRIFSPDSNSKDLVGRYIMCNIRRNRYGFSTDSVVTVDSAFPYSPDVEVSERYITNAFADSPDVLRLLADSRFIEFAKQMMDLEPGYILVRLAIELDIASELVNITKDIDVGVLKRCLLVDKFRVFNQASPLKRDIINFVTASKYVFEKKGEVLRTLYSDDESFTKERLMFQKVCDMADTIINIKKGRV